MATKKDLIANYLKHRFFEQYDVDGHDLTIKPLKLLENNLSPEEFRKYKSLDQATRNITSLLSEDEEREGTPADEKQINDYEKLADSTKLPRAVRIKMYDMVLIGHEKYIPRNTAYLNVLSKKISLLDKSYVADLKHAVMLIKQHNSCLSSELPKNLLLKVQHKLSDKYYPDQQELADLKRKDAQEKNQHKLELSRKKLADLEKKIAENPEPEEHFKLLQQKLDLVSKCGLGRLNTCRTKVKICQELQYWSHFLNKENDADFYAREQEHLEKVENNIFKYMNLRKKGRI